MSLDRLLEEALGADDAPALIVLAGSNGAGKTTFFETFLRETGVACVNADEIGRALNPRDPQANPYEAARLADLMRRDLLARGETFCMETVLSDREGAKLAFFREAQAAGYRVILVWICIASVELSVARVMQRVEAGGHDVPDEKLEARFPRTLENAEAALRCVDLGLVIDNSSVDRPFRHVTTWKRGALRERRGGDTARHAGGEE